MTRCTAPDAVPARGMNRYSRTKTDSYGKRHLRARWKIEPSGLLAVERGFVLLIAPECDSGRRSFPYYRGLQWFASNRIGSFFVMSLVVVKWDAHLIFLPLQKEQAITNRRSLRRCFLSSSAVGWWTAAGGGVSPCPTRDGPTL